MAIEIERKFRVLDDSWRVLAHRRTLLRQGYLANTAKASIRVRVAGDEGWVSVKSMTPGLSRSEFEYPVPRADAEALLKLCDGPLLEKWRHLVQHDADEWEIDEFLGDNAGLVVAELELDSESQAFAQPAWLGEEVTQQERFYNFRLSQHPYRRWSQES